MRQGAAAPANPSDLAAQSEELAPHGALRRNQQPLPGLPKRAGLLGAIGHDLEIGVGTTRSTSPRIGRQIDARFAAESLCVIDAVRDGRLRPGTLSALDKATIDRHMANDILHARAFPTVAFHSDAVDFRDGAGYRRARPARAARHTNARCTSPSTAMAISSWPSS